MLNSIQHKRSAFTQHREDICPQALGVETDQRPTTLSRIWANMTVFNTRNVQEGRANEFVQGLTVCPKHLQNIINVFTWRAGCMQISALTSTTQC